MTINQYPDHHDTNSSDRIIMMACNKLGRSATVSSGPFSTVPTLQGYPSTHVDAKAVAGMYRDQYEACRRELLEAGDWMFATERTSLVFDEQYGLWKLPEDLIKIIKVGECGERLRGERFANYIEICCSCCDCILYIRDERNVGLFSPKFVRALVNKLAYEIGFASGASETALNRIFKDYVFELSDARKTNLQQKAVRTVRDPNAGYGGSYCSVSSPRRACGDCC